MLKKFLFFVLVCCSGLLWGQVTIGGESTYLLTTKFHIERGFSACKGEGGIEYIYAGNVLIFNEQYYNSGNERTITTEFTKHSKVTYLKFESVSTTKAAIGCKSTEGYESYVTLNNSECSITEGSIYAQNPRNIIYNIKVEPKVTLNPPSLSNSTISSDEYLTITLPDNIDSKYYNWEYSVGGIDNFEPFPSEFNNKATLKLKGSDFLSDSEYGKTVYIRVNMGACNLSNPNTSNTISLEAKKSSPSLIGFETQNTSKDGQLFSDWTNLIDNKISGLKAGGYKVRFRDKNGCIAKDPNNPNIEKVTTFEILEPESPVTIEDIQLTPPSGYGLKNGTISLNVVGGRFDLAKIKYSQDSYKPNLRLVLYDISGVTKIVPFDQYAYEDTDGLYKVTFKNLPAGKYRLLTVVMANPLYEVSLGEEDRCVAIQEFELTQPDPLVSKLEVQKEISCNGANLFATNIDTNNNQIPDQAEDGTIKVSVTGGVGEYTYQWQMLSGDTFVDVVGETKNILSKGTKGTYKVKVLDANKNASEATYTFGFPNELKAILSANQISCFDNQSGMVEVVATGGTGELSYLWNTSDTTPKVTGLSGGKYFVMVSDQNQCRIKGSVEVVEPNRLEINDISIVNPTCFGESNGEIQTQIKGGVAPYSIVWSNGKTTENISGLTAGKYTITVTDSSGCISTKEYTLLDPKKLVVDLGPDVTLCVGDSKEFNIKLEDPNTKYLWKNGDGTTIGTSSNITLNQAGVYTLYVEDSKGCSGVDSVEIKRSNEVLDPLFMITTHAYKEASVVLVNTSITKPESVEWIIPNDANIQVINKTEDYLELKFAKIGSYQIGLKGFQGECSKTYYKSVVVEENTSGVNLSPNKLAIIKDFQILPNPNSGEFKVKVVLDVEKQIKIRIIDMVSNEAFPASILPKSSQFEVPFSIDLPIGVYLVVLEVGDQFMVKRMIIQ
ncbi:MAG: hypothetical protein C4K58_04485 [Flavobacteriaceae bacterium]|nr:MAG: hypothetical protein C4K58_04485 [Flavobacteriaceae bacterium]